MTAANGGTFGQSVDIAGDFGSRQYVTGLRSDFNFRTNVGFVNNGAAAIPVHAVVLSSIGTVLGTLNLSLGPQPAVSCSALPNSPFNETDYIGCGCTRTEDFCHALFLQEFHVFRRNDAAADHEDVIHALLFQ
jgi:hypothetical protein